MVGEGMLSFWSGICIGVHASLHEGSFVALCCMSFQCCSGQFLLPRGAHSFTSSPEGSFV